MAQQTMVFLQSMVLGALLGLLFDDFRIIRIAIPATKLFVAMQDIVFFAVCAAATFLFLLSGADGKVRFFLIIGEVLGAVIYFCSLSIVVMSFSRVIISVVHWLINLVMSFVILPILKIISQIVEIMLWPLRFLNNIWKKVCQRAKYSLKRHCVLLYNHIKAYLSRFGFFVVQKNSETEKGHLSESED